MMNVDEGGGESTTSRGCVLQKPSIPERFQDVPEEFRLADNIHKKLQTTTVEFKKNVSDIQQMQEQEIQKVRKVYQKAAQMQRFQQMQLVEHQKAVTRNSPEAYRMSIQDGVISSQLGGSSSLFIPEEVAIKQMEAEPLPVDEKGILTPHKLPDLTIQNELVKQQTIEKLELNEKLRLSAKFQRNLILRDQKQREAKDEMTDSSGSPKKSSFLQRPLKGESRSTKPYEQSLSTFNQLQKDITTKSFIQQQLRSRMQNNELNTDREPIRKGALWLNKDNSSRQGMNSKMTGLYHSIDVSRANEVSPDQPPPIGKKQVSSLFFSQGPVNKKQVSVNTSIDTGPSDSRQMFVRNIEVKKYPGIQKVRQMGQSFVDISQSQPTNLIGKGLNSSVRYGNDRAAGFLNQRSSQILGPTQESSAGISSMHVDRSGQAAPLMAGSPQYLMYKSKFQTPLDHSLLPPTDREKVYNNSTYAETKTPFNRTLAQSHQSSSVFDQFMVSSLHQEAQQKVQQFCKLDDQFTSSFVYNHNNANLATIAQKAIIATMGGKIKKQNIGAMQSRRYLQENLELMRIEHKARRAQLEAHLTSTTSVQEVLPLQQQQIIGIGLNNSPTPQLASSTLQIDPSTGASRLTINPLEQKLLQLDILEDKQEEIQKIVQKKKKLNMSVPNQPLIMGEPQRIAPQTTQNSKLPITLALGGKGGKEISRVFPSSQDPFTQFDRSQVKQKGGGFFSPTNKILEIHAKHVKAVSPYIKEKTLLRLPESTGSFDLSDSGLPRIINTTITPMDTLKTDTSKISPLPKSPSKTPGYVMKGVHPPKISQMSAEQYANHETQLKEERAKQQQVKGGQPNIGMNLNFEAIMKIYNVNTSDKKAGLKDYVTQGLGTPQREVTPRTMKQRIQTIIKNENFLESGSAKDKRVKKYRLQQYQSDFEMKMDKMNYQLQKELEHKIRTQPSLSGISYPAHKQHVTIDDGSGQVFSTTTESPQVNKRVIQMLKDVDSGVREVKTRPIQSMKRNQPLEDKTELKEPDITHQSSLSKDSLVIGQLSSIQPPTLRGEIDQNYQTSSYHQAEVSLKGRLMSHIKSLHESIKTKSLNKFDIVSEDWLSFKVGSQDTKSIEEIQKGETKIEEHGQLKRKEESTMTFERLYTPPEEVKVSHSLGGNVSERQKEVENWMMKLKQEQRDFYDMMDADVLGQGKDADHLTDKEIESISKLYMPALKVIEAKMKELDTQPTKQIKKSSQIAQVSNIRADESKVKSKAIQQFIDGIKKESEFYGIAKNLQAPAIDSKIEKDPRAQFYFMCWQTCVLAMPTLAKIKNMTLSLKDYKMNLGLCKALGASLILYHNVVQKIIIESCGMDDQMLAAILDGLKEQLAFKAITYKKNQLDSQSIESLITLINRPMPCNLDEVRIINCKINPLAIEDFLEQIQGSEIRRLSLVKCQINSAIFQLVLQLLQKSRSLIELDISWNNLTPLDTKKLLKILKTNRQLQVLNISWNNMQDIPKKDQQAENEHEELKKSLRLQIIETQLKMDVLRAQRDRMLKEAKELKKNKTSLKKKEGDQQSPPPENADDTQAPKIPTEEEIKTERIALKQLKKQLQKVLDGEKKLTKEEKEILKNLGKFIKQNKYLQQLDLSHTQMGSNLLREIVTTLKRSKSLLVLNVSGNRGVTDDVRNYLSERIRCKPDPYDLERFTYINQFITDLNKNYDNLNKKNEKIVESMQVRGIRWQESSKFSNKLTTIKTYQQNENLLYQRILGHKDEIPGSAQWIETSTSTTPPELLQDWVSDKCIYTLVFWSKNFAKKNKSTQLYSQKEVKLLASLIKKPDMKKVEQVYLNQKNALEPMPFMTAGDVVQQDRYFEKPPLLAGSMNGWHYSQMFKIEELLMMLDKKYEDPITALIERGQLRDNLKGVKDMSKAEFIKYIKQRLKTEKFYKSNWLTILLKECIRFKNPCMINLNQFDEYPLEDKVRDSPEFEDFLTEQNGKLNHRNLKNRICKYLNEELNDKENQLWVGVTMSRPGRHTYLVQYEDFDDEEGGSQSLKISELDAIGEKLMDQHSSNDSKKGSTKYSMHRCIIPAREEEVPPFAKIPKNKVNVRTFKKETSVFKDWVSDTDFSLNKCFQADIANWKLHRVIKEEYDLRQVERVLRQNFSKIKKIFTCEASKSGFPCINWIKYSDFCSECDIIDENVSLATIDRIFIITNVELEKHVDNPPTALQRFEFLEILARIAQVKFKETGVFDTFSESLQKLLDDHVLKMADQLEWQEFREKKLWTVEVNDVFEANLDLLQKVYAKYFEPRKKQMSMKDGLSFMMKDTHLSLIEKDAVFCYGMCKMTVEKENESNKQYFELKFVEFLEMIGRVAEAKYKNTPIYDMPLAKRIEYCLDEIIPPMIEEERREVQVVAEEDSESDDDY